MTSMVNLGNGQFFDTRTMGKRKGKKANNNGLPGMGGV
jgi:hypothetical protein